MSINERIKHLQSIMKEKGIDAYIIPSSDAHQSEYVADHYASRAFITGFTGSAGTAVVTQQEAGLWTDGRYFVQAEQELAGTVVKLFRMGEENVPTIENYLQELPNGSTIGFDGNVISIAYFRRLQQALEHKQFSFVSNWDLIELIWEDRPAIPKTEVIDHDVQFTGKSREEKIKEVQAKMRSLQVDHYVLSGLDDIAWLLNIRGRDIKHNPLTIAYFALTLNTTHLFIDEEKLTADMKEKLVSANITIHPYEAITAYLKELSEGTILLDPSKTNVNLFNTIQIETKEARDITTELKAIKNKTEIANVRNVMVRDGVAMVKFIKWLKDTIKEKPITEIEASDKLEYFRSLDDRYFDTSFSTISAYQANASMPHYSATLENQATIEPRGFYLVDSGGQYYDGTTDITRTIVMGELTEEEKMDYTLVLKGMIRLSKQVFVYGSTGSNLDIVARIPLWDHGLDFKHGTGHGIGFFLNVHEGPHSISSAPNPVKLEEGMITSNEPGVYKANKHGIRIENLLVVEKAEKTTYGGQFMRFETLTLCPIDTEAIDTSLLSQDEIDWFNNYHQLVFEKLSPHLNDDEVAYLKEVTQPIE